jgi:hypothetical protein
MPRPERVSQLLSMGLIANIFLRFANKETGLRHIGHIIALAGIEVAYM